ncbi:hypothetical protein ACFVOO_16125 [Streptomyces rochei]|uniref:hypothetical protein n=1 Tax=Streptomyces rochei TaxID=1928 RepID=UPI003694FA5A
MSTRLEVLGDDGEWHGVEGVRSVELVEEQPGTAPDDSYWRRHDALDSLRFAMPQLEVEIRVDTTSWDEAVARARGPVRSAFSQLLGDEEPRPRVIDQDGNPVRPAWQSPYGPPPRRH